MAGRLRLPRAGGRPDLRHPDARARRHRRGPAAHARGAHRAAARESRRLRPGAHAGLRLLASRPRHRARPPHPCRDAARTGRGVAQRAARQGPGRPCCRFPQARIPGGLRRRLRAQLRPAGHPPDPLDQRPSTAHCRRRARRHPLSRCDRAHRLADRAARQPARLRLGAVRGRPLALRAIRQPGAGRGRQYRGGRPLHRRRQRRAFERAGDGALHRHGRGRRPRARPRRQRQRAADRHCRIAQAGMGQCRADGLDEASRHGSNLAASMTTAPPTFNVDQTSFRTIGRPVPRKEDARLTTGHGRFSDDFNTEGQAHAVMVRSPHPHARIRAVEAARAKALPGVLGVFTGAACLADDRGASPHDPLPKTRYDMKLTGPGGGTIFIGPHLLLPADKARHVGEAVAMVVAEAGAEALDAAEAVEIDYELLPGVYHSEDAMRPGAPAIWDEVRDNILVDTVFGDRAATDQAFASADHVVAMDFHVDRVTGVPIEPRAALGAYDAGSGRYTLHAGSGGAVRQKRELASILGVSADNLRVLSYDVGGNFGTRNRVFVEFALVLWAARKLRRPVKFTATRSEAFLSDYQGRDLVTKVELALRRDGRFLAMRATNISK